MQQEEVPRAPPAAVVRDAESELARIGVETERMMWVYATFITPDTEHLAGRAHARLMEANARWARRLIEEARGTASPLDARKIDLLRTTQAVWAPLDPAHAEELPRLIRGMEATYARGRHRPRGRSEALNLESLEKILASSRDPSEMLDVWAGWHAVGRGIRADFARYVTLANEGAREAGFSDQGAMWRSRYDMPPEELLRETERLWADVEPLYRLLTEFVRRRLRATYGDDVVPAAGPMPAHIFGNMWAQSWEYLLPILLPDAPRADLTGTLRSKGTTPEQLVRYAERFFVSIGFPPLPGTFWERSMFVRPRDRHVVCHASAWDVDGEEDLRLKMCIDVTEEEFHVIHHELGHNYYQWAYREQPWLFREGAQDGFHEAVGDTIGLSVTPEYLVQVNLLEPEAAREDDIARLLRQALAKVAFLPFGLVIDRWRWDVFAGRVAPEEYNASWWELRGRYQGVTTPEPRGEGEFDPGAKFHVPANVPYLRYFFAHILQFQFHRALARTINHPGPVHRCSIYGHPEAGRRLRAMLALGASRPWPEALKALTGERRMDAGALREYFRPLEEWLRRAT